MAEENPITDAIPPTVPVQNITDLDANLAATQATIEKLQRLKDLQDQVETLKSQLMGRNPDEALSSPYRDLYDPSGRGQDIKLENIPTFTLNSSLQQRQEWLLDLQQQFEGDRRRFHDDRTQILGALSYMDTTCRQRWYRHVDEKALTLQRNPKEDWPYFQDWTLTLIKNAASLESEVMSQLEKARQQRDEDPREFHARLDTLERHFPRIAEKERALSFFAKLLYDLQDEVRRHIIKLPETREEMIDIAYHFWDLQRSEANRKRKRTESTEERSRKKDSYQNSQTTNMKRGWKPKTDKDTPTKTRLNPIGENGKRNQCFNCGSEKHYSNKCPDPLKDQPTAAAQSVHQGNDSETD
jgi:DNA repair exonuclease SbcCD ATPase subunit